jgi:hypothetical protein
MEERGFDYQWKNLKCADLEYTQERIIRELLSLTNPQYNWSYIPKEIKRWFEEEGFKRVKLTKKYMFNHSFDLINAYLATNGNL